jgi:transcriptional regulator with GAF, ATPase, and Fis domain
LAHIVVATNHDLKNRVAEGRFRSDLYFRLKMLEIILPPLRECQADIAALLAYFAEATARRYGIVQPVVSPDAETVLKRYHWPGNVRELRHVIERAVMSCSQGRSDVEHLLLEQQVSASGSQCTLDELSQMTLEQVEKYLLERALQRTNENVSGAARELGLTRMAMRYRMDKYGL